MPGARPRGWRFGDRGELLAESILSSIAFTVRVPRQEDVGHDLLCTIAERDGNLQRAGPFFTVQIKSDRGGITYEKEYEVAWIQNQDNPFFICVANRKDLTIEMYSTWNMLNGFLLKGAQRIVLVPSGPDADYEQVATVQGEQTVPLGRPVLRMSMEDAMHEARAQALGAVLREWVEIDRENIVNRAAGMYWVVGPLNYETNKSPLASKESRIAFFWNAKNLEPCCRNFGRPATALRLVVRKAFGANETRSWGQEQLNALECVLISCSGHLEPLAKKVLHERLGLTL